MNAGFVTVKSSLLRVSVNYRAGRVINSPNNLEVRALVEVAPCLPVILCERILDAYNRVLAGELLVLLCQLLVGNPLAWVAVWVLEVQVVLLLLSLVELARCYIHGDLHLTSVACLLDRIGYQGERLFRSLDIWCNATLITNVTCRLTILLLRERL